MEQLNVFEMEQVAAGTLDGLLDRLGGAAIGAITCATWGTLIGGTQSGANGGLLGFGLLSNLVGMFWGLAMGAVIGGVGGFAVGWDTMLAVNEKSFNNVADGKFVPWGH
ncbi:hypothetical protein [Klebsiella grimontii]|uniref:hypothetical protein n=1 Tax=Klebsiella grimontii TaxID=2058152 RepID=UPI001C81B51A|nr:hypothetical protein [Klebsiella grimontii]MBX4825174.1 hypothetical protein [Klebsiella grimontii]